ncbi:MAG: hypothetical protein ACRDT6_16735 [Micromonosporaceae bacterium]
MPPPTGAELGAELELLLQVARRDLPPVALAYLRANGSIAATGEADKQAFMRSQEGFSGSHSVTGPVYPAWAALRDEFQRILGETADAVTDIARALEMVVFEYARTDDEAAAELKRLIADERDPITREALRQPRADKLPEPEIPTR